MTETVEQITEAGSVLAILEGGPATIPSASRIQSVGPQDEKFKLPYYGGYEHFERTGESSGSDRNGRIVLRWTMRPKLAE